MSKIVVIGDIHGRDVWKKIIIQECPDKVIFIGDYLDGKINIKNQWFNFEDIIEYAQCSNTVLLLGNHDYHYINGISEQYSGYNHSTKLHISDLLTNSIDCKLVKLVHVEDNIMFSHAGVSNTFLRRSIKDIGLNYEEVEDIEEFLNDLLFYTQKTIGFGYYNNGEWNDAYGDNAYQSPIWIRPESLIKDKIDNYIQVVGHTSQETITQKENIYFIDTLEVNEFLVINDGKISTGKLDS